ncbi:MAG: hypothetical protein FJ148_19840 [Deltaproteobacteria bacterium]|nr:hypothetical protein [Deltaproteobacteria bacterium]
MGGEEAQSRDLYICPLVGRRERGSTPLTRPHGTASPPGGHIGVFDRSHYEDVLVVRVHDLVPRDVWEPRYDEINAFEKELVDSGTTIVKCAMFVSLDEQKRRLAERPDRPGSDTKTRTPPGRSTRAISAKRPSRSEEWWIEATLNTASAQPSASGRRCASAQRRSKKLRSAAKNRSAVSRPR